MNRILILLFLLIIWNPLQSYAAVKNSSILSIKLESSLDNTLVPGDNFTETFLIENLSSDFIRFRICQVSNEGNSKLFSIMQGYWNTSNEILSPQSLEHLTTDWISLAPKERISLPLSLCFPADCGNQYQNAELKAKFLFVYQYISKNNTTKTDTKIPIYVSHPCKNGVSVIPSTKDNNTTMFPYLGLCSFSIGTLFLLSKRKKGAFFHD